MTWRAKAARAIPHNVNLLVTILDAQGYLDIEQLDKLATFPPPRLGACLVAASVLSSARVRMRVRVISWTPFYR